MAEQAAHYYELFNQAAALIEEYEGLKPTKPSRNWRKKDVVTAPEFLRGLALERKDETVAVVEQLWEESLALEAVLVELAEDFSGEDIVLPEFRERHAETRARIQAAARQVALRHLPDAPDDELLRSYKDVVAESFRHLGYSEV